MASELPDLEKLTLTDEKTPKSSQKEYTYRGSGTDKEGNHYCLRDYGPNTKNKHPYHYSNKDGSYGYNNPDGSKYYNDGKEKSWYEPVPGVNLFKDGDDGKWSKQPLKAQPGMSSAGFEKIQGLIARESSAASSPSQPERSKREIKYEETKDIAYSENGVTDRVAEGLASWETSHNDGHHVRGSYGGRDEARSNSAADNNAHYVTGGYIKGEYEWDHKGYDSGYGNSAVSDNNSGSSSNSGYRGTGAGLEELEYIGYDY